MDTDEEIEKILNEISITENSKGLKQIMDRNTQVIDAIYSDVLKYEINIKNKQEVSTFIHNNFEYIELNKDTKSCWICYLDNSTFYNLRIHMRGLFIKFKTKETILLKYNKKYFVVNINEKVFFKKINNKDLIKMHLIDALSNK
tara:strand:+ start:6524 stop:6955 length:432 start_codon:yes stop_codon:yes gene_type:complete